MKIIEETYKWSGSFGERNRTEEIIIHHRAGNGTVQSLHCEHVANGWVGIGYHFYVRKDGSIYRGRPLNAVGAHCVGRNATSVGVCFEGNYQAEKTMPKAQSESGKQLISYLKGIFPYAEIIKHKDCITTLCPGKYFPFDDIVKEDKITVQEAVKLIKEKAGIEDKTINFLLCYKYGEELVIKLANVMR